MVPDFLEQQYLENLCEEEAKETNKEILMQLPEFYFFELAEILIKV